MKVFAIGSAPKPITDQQRQEIMPKEVPDTLKLYLDGRIEQFWFRDDKPGVVFLMNVDSVEHAIPQSDEHIDLYLETNAAFVRTFTISFQTQVDWDWFKGKDIEGRVNVMRQVVKETVEQPPEAGGFADVIQQGRKWAGVAHLVEFQEQPVIHLVLGGALAEVADDRVD